MEIDIEKRDLLKKSLKRNRIGTTFFQSATALVEMLRKELVPGITVGVGDSKTLESLGVYELLRNSPVQFLDKYRPDLTRAEKDKLYRDNFSSDMFLSGINALTLEGEIFNLDGNGSRVAPIIFGPKRVILVCGTNKIVENDDEAIQRIRNVAAPIDAQRLEKKTPCVKTGKCMNCKSVEKICNYYTIVQGQFNEERIRVFVVDGDYGF